MRIITILLLFIALESKAQNTIRYIGNYQGNNAVVRLYDSLKRPLLILDDRVYMIPDKCFDRNFGGDQANNNRNFGGDQANNNRNFGGDQANNNRNFGGDQANNNRNFGGDQANNNRNFSGDQANNNRNFGGDQANNNRNFGGDQANSDRNFGGDRTDLKFKCDQKKGTLVIYLNPVQISYERVKNKYVYFKGISDSDIRIEKY
jgi:hypothetical protein